jgi:hypothetical protein
MLPTKSLGSSTLSTTMTRTTVGDLPRPAKETGSIPKRVKNVRPAKETGSIPKRVKNVRKVTSSTEGKSAKKAAIDGRNRKRLSAPSLGIFTRDAPADRWTYTVPVPLHSILEVLELIMPEQMSALADHNIRMMNDGAFANVRLPSYASVIDALMQ